MKWCAVVLVCTGCLQPNPSFKPGSTSGASETASEGSTTADIGTASPETADDDDDATSIATLGDSSGAVTTTDPTVDDESDGSSTTGVAEQHTMFVTSVDAFGDVGSIAAVDALCNELATNAGLGGTWLAVISDSTVDAGERIVVNGPIRNVMGDLIAEDGPDLWDGFIGAPVGYTENGDEFLATPFTGTQPDGTAAADNCEDWTRASGGTAVIGDAGYAGEAWIESAVDNCNSGYPFYCISQ